MSRDIMKRLENMIGDCVIGPMRTLKTMDIADLLYDARNELECLQAREARLREALNYYAKNHYPNVNDGPWGANSVDFGNVARAALAEHGEK